MDKKKFRELFNGYKLHISVIKTVESMTGELKDDIALVKGNILSIDRIISLLQVPDGDADGDEYLLSIYDIVLFDNRSNDIVITFGKNSVIIKSAAHDVKTFKDAIMKVRSSLNTMLELLLDPIDVTGEVDKVLLDRIGLGSGKN